MKEFLALLDQLTQQLDTEATTLVQAAARMARYIQADMGCSRVCVWQRLGSAEAPSLTRVASFDSTGTERTEPLVFGDPGFAVYFDRITHQGVFVSDDILADDRVAGMRETYLIPYSVRAALYATIGVNGATSAMLCCSQTDGPRRWTPQEVRRLKAYADAISLRRARRWWREAEAASLAERLRRAQALPATESGAS
jgi:GAF domain-containing protein